MPINSPPKNPFHLLDKPMPEIVAFALNKWSELTGINASDISFRIGDLGIREMNRMMQKVLELEPEGTTAFMMLEVFLREYLESKTFTASSIMKDYARTTEFLRKAEELFSIVQSDRALEETGFFRQKILIGTASYDADSDDVTKMVNDMDVLPFLRRDALDAVTRLKPFQFLAGEADSKPPQVIRHVYQAWDINELLIALRDMPFSGIAVILIRNPAHADRSYFAFAMRNGGRVIIFADKTRPVYPGQEDALAERGARSAGRRFMERAYRNHFPYQVIKQTFDEKGDVHFEKESSPVLYGKTLVALMPIGTLPPHQVIWITMMLSLIAEKFWTKSWQADSLSYTGAMIQQKSLLVTDRAGNHLPVAAGYRPVGLNDVSVDELDRGNLNSQVQRKESGINTWLEERYGRSVPPEVINTWFSSSDETLMLPKEIKESRPTWPRSGNEISIIRKLSGGIIAAPEQTRLSTWEKAPGYTLQTFSSTDFGTEEELKADRLWIARHNQAKWIQKKADEEFFERKNLIARWYYDGLLANIDGLIAIIASHLAGINRFHAPPGGYRRLVFGEKKSSEFPRDYYYHNTLGVAIGRKPTYPCILTGSASTHYRAFFNPQTADDIALMVGKEIADLPDVLRHWRYEKQYAGNHLLDRLDPVEALVHDPWAKLPLQANLYLSKRGIKIVESRKPNPETGAYEDNDAEPRKPTQEPDR